MYGVAGLQTPRGSGTSGYVQSNKFLARSRPSGRGATPAGALAAGRNPNGEFLEHERKRRIQLRLLVLEEALVDQGYTANEIAERLVEARAAYEAEAPRPTPTMALVEGRGAAAMTQRRRKDSTDPLFW